ncbi:MAG: DUF2029 domain-containing protein [Candidatus Sumerlaeaceae bacterium]|nr:DUF2029 domain-containing protein [Candidatus Sumerlaeaceae bacterium]
MGSDGWEVFKYPQFLAALTSWLGACPLRIAELIWKLFMLSCILLIGGLSARHILAASDRGEQCLPWRLYRSLHVGGTLAALSFFSPLSWSLELGQVGPLLALVVLIAYLAISSGNESRASVATALGALIKVSPGLLLFPFVIRRRWHAVNASAAVLITYMAALAFLVRLRDELTYFTSVAPEIPALTHYVSHSLFQILTKVARVDPDQTPEGYRLSLVAFQSIALVLYLAMLGMLARRKCSLGQLWLVSLTGLVVISPVVEGHHFVVLWPAFLEFYRNVLVGRLPRVFVPLHVLVWLPIFLSAPLNKLSTAETLRFLPTTAALILWLLTSILAYLNPCNEDNDAVVPPAALTTDRRPSP